MNDFWKFARSPLGIIAMFIIVDSWITSYLVNNFDKFINSCERIPIIWFMVGFPLIVLLVFALITLIRKNTLFGPQDFRGDDAFLAYIAPSLDVAKKQDSEKRYAVKQSNCKSVSIADLSWYDKAEKECVKAIEKKYDIQMNHNVAFKDAYGAHIFDAVGEDKGIRYFLEVKLLISGNMGKQALSNIRRAIELLNRNIGMHGYYRFIVALVSESLNGVDKGVLINQLMSINPNVIIEFYEKNDLLEYHSEVNIIECKESVG